VLFPAHVAALISRLHELRVGGINGLHAALDISCSAGTYGGPLLPYVDMARYRTSITPADDLGVDVIPDRIARIWIPRREASAASQLVISRGGKEQTDHNVPNGVHPVRGVIGGSQQATCGLGRRAGRIRLGGFPAHTVVHMVPGDRWLTGQLSRKGALKCRWLQ
jgi:hypothetical protein